MKPYPQPILLRLSDVSDVSASTAHRSAYVTTTLPAIVQGLRNLECQPDPFNEFQGPDALFSRLLDVMAPHLNADLQEARAEVEQSRIELEDERERVNVQREDIRTLRLEVQRLTEEARRSDAGRVEVPERAAWLTIEEIAAVVETGAADYKMNLLRSQALHIARLIACASMDKGARLSPSPQPSADVVVNREETIEVLGFTIKNGCSSKSCYVAKPMQGTNGPCSCIPGFVSVPTKIKIIAALHSSTNHDAQDAGGEG